MTSRKNQKSGGCECEDRVDAVLKASMKSRAFNADMTVQELMHLAIDASNGDTQQLPDVAVWDTYLSIRAPCD